MTKGRTPERQAKPAELRLIYSACRLICHPGLKLATQYEKEFSERMESKLVPPEEDSFLQTKIDR